eukprot:6264097-Karenia_brevis.AAC.1
MMPEQAIEADRPIHLYSSFTQAFGRTVKRQHKSPDPLLCAFGAIKKKKEGGGYRNSAHEQVSL